NRKQDFDAWLELAVGYDSNTNVAPSNTLISWRAFGGEWTADLDGEDSSAFYRAKLGFSWRLPVSTHWDVVSGGKARLTRNTGVTDDMDSGAIDFDTVGMMRGHTGVSAHYGRQRFGLMLRGRYDNFG